ncbi:centriolar coiled-coil protein of 110 kDa isoform X1 [Sorex araneus]|uniref:centriolar coiled-coil protein of 110 kDa isoform X1 n=1 Tax=Sorex araneus TaxID=42254 RepID=UPI0024335D6D|nr:centriolar coiled-coil protein of 110 kDa isoform X1 [Sorex araneus]XP_054991217.1 centriolar coiled-coil protein of 110 kDa isoform X1 [Sorex araneus]
MEEYEKFCEESLARIQEAPLSADNFLPPGSDSVSLIRFHGVAVLSPLLNLEKRKEMRQEKQRALDVEARKQVNRKKVLLTRVQEIIENVQVRKAPSVPAFELWEMETVYSHPDAKSLDVAPAFPNLLPGPVEHSTLAGPERPAGPLPANHEDPSEANGMDVATEPEALGPLKPGDRSDSGRLDSDALPMAHPAASLETLFLESSRPASGDQELSPGGEGTPDPYVLSLQNLMKKSREYIEQSRRSLSAGGRRSAHDSHSDKENDAVRVTARAAERAQPAGRHGGAVIPDKPSLNKSNVLLQGVSASASSLRGAGWGGLSHVDLPLVPTGPAAGVDPHPAGQGLPAFVPENNVIRSLPGSYAKLPSPEPSLSPQMHRRRSRPSSACHILINNPINACDLSPKGKDPAVDAVVPEAPGPDPVPKFPFDVAGVVGPGRVHGSTHTPEAVEEPVAGKLSPAPPPPGSLPEDELLHGLALAEGQSAADGRGPHQRDSAGPAVPRIPEPGTAGPIAPSPPNVATAGGLKPAGALEKNASPSQPALNKSYDVKNPSPLLLQSQSARPHGEPPAAPAGRDQVGDPSLEKVKRRLDLDADGLQKENCPLAMAGGVSEPERPQLSEKRLPKASGCLHRSKILESASKEGEEILRCKMLAFEEMRKRLEEQHAQQLSLLIAEQEREQERLQKEIQEQEKLLKEKKLILAEASELAVGKAADSEWRKMSDAGLLEAMLAQADPRRPRSPGGSGLQHGLVSATDAPFYLWGSAASGLAKLPVPRPSGRAKAKWSQVFSAEVQVKFDKITAVARGFLTRRLMQTDKLKQLRQTVKDTMEFIRSFQSEAPLRRGVVSAQDASLQERVLAQLRAALYDIHDIFFVMDAAERMSILHHDREVRKEKMLRQMDKMKSPRVALSAATQKSLDRKKFMKAAEMGMPNKKFLVKQNPSEARVLQPNQGQNAPAHRLLSRQGTPKAAVKGGVPARQKPSQSREPSRAPASGVYAGKIQRKRPNVATI